MFTSLLFLNMPPTVGLSGKASVNVPEFNSGNSETGNKINDYVLKLSAVGLDSDCSNLPKHWWSTDIDN